MIEAALTKSHLRLPKDRECAEEVEQGQLRKGDEPSANGHGCQALGKRCSGKEAVPGLRYERRVDPLPSREGGHVWKVSSFF